MEQIEYNPFEKEWEPTPDFYQESHIDFQSQGNVNIVLEGEPHRLRTYTIE